MPSVRVSVEQGLDSVDRLVHCLGTQHLTNDSGQMTNLIKSRTQLVLIENSRIESKTSLGGVESESECCPCFSSPMADLFEQVFEVAPVRSENIGKDCRVVGMM